VPLVLLDGFLSDEQGEHFGFGDGGDAGEFVDGFGVVKAFARAIEGNGEVPVIAHPLNVALEGFGGDFEVSGETECVWESLCSDELMDFEESFVCVATQDQVGLPYSDQGGVPYLILI
jgi:hypothetical protein